MLYNRELGMIYRIKGDFCSQEIRFKSPMGSYIFGYVSDFLAFTSAYLLDLRTNLHLYIFTVLKFPHLLCICESFVKDCISITVSCYISINYNCLFEYHTESNASNSHKLAAQIQSSKYLLHSMLGTATIPK